MSLPPAASPPVQQSLQRLEIKVARPVSSLTEPGGKGKEEQSGTLLDAQLETEFEERDLDIAMLSRKGSEKKVLQKG